MNNTKKIPNANRLAELLHPKYQHMVISEIVEYNKTTKMFVMKSADQKELAYFEAGSYIPVYVEIDGNVVERPYSLCSSPHESEMGIYKIVVKASVGGYISTHIINSWKQGDHVTLGAPLKAEVYSPVRDKKEVVALAGGVGVTPFYSMAKAIVDGDNQHKLTLIYGVNTYDELLFKEDWKELEQKSNGNFKMVPVIANEEIEGCEKGFITLDIVKKYADLENTSFFLSGPPPMIHAVKNFLDPLGLPRKQVRVSMNGDGGFNHIKDIGKNNYKLIIHMGGKVCETEAKSNETVLVAIEKAGLRPAVHCRSGSCGFCRAMVIKGEFRLATDEAGVRKADQKFGFIHPCCSYPVSDMEIVVQRG